MTKEDLKEYRSICAELRRLDGERLKWLSRAEKSTRPPTEAPVLYGVHDPMPVIVDALTDIREAAARQTLRLREVKHRIERAIDKLPAIQRRLMTLRYIDGKSWEAIEHELSFSASQVLRFHNKALISIIRKHANRVKYKSNITVSISNVV